MYAMEKMENDKSPQEGIGTKIKKKFNETIQRVFGPQLIDFIGNFTNRLGKNSSQTDVLGTIKEFLGNTTSGMTNGGLMDKLKLVVKKYQAELNGTGEKIKGLVKEKLGSLINQTKSMLFGAGRLQGALGGNIMGVISNLTKINTTVIEKMFKDALGNGTTNVTSFVVQFIGPIKTVVQNQLKGIVGNNSKQTVEKFFGKFKDRISQEFGNLTKQIVPLLNNTDMRSMLEIQFRQYAKNFIEILPGNHTHAIQEELDKQDILPEIQQMVLGLKGELEKGIQDEVAKLAKQFGGNEILKMLKINGFNITELIDGKIMGDLVNQTKERIKNELNKLVQKIKDKLDVAKNIKTTLTAQVDKLLGRVTQFTDVNKITNFISKQLTDLVGFDVTNSSSMVEEFRKLITDAFKNLGPFANLGKREIDKFVREKLTDLAGAGVGNFLGGFLPGVLFNLTSNIRGMFDRNATMRRETTKQIVEKLVGGAIEALIGSKTIEMVETALGMSLAENQGAKNGTRPSKLQIGNKSEKIFIHKRKVTQNL